VHIVPGYFLAQLSAFLEQVNKSTLFTTLEKTTATSRVMYDTELKFMPEDAYIKHVAETLLTRCLICGFSFHPYTVQ